MVKKACEKERNENQQLKLENKQLREKNSKLSNYIKHNRHKLSNPDAAEEILIKCENSHQEPIKNTKKDNETKCPKCQRKKLIEKSLSMPNNTLLTWKQCPDAVCRFRSESETKKLHMEYL